MLPSALTFPWILWRQNCAGLVLALGFLLFAAGMVAMAPAFVEPRSENAYFFLLCVLAAVALLAVPIFLLCVFAYGLDGADVCARASCFPPHLFRLPVRTAALVIWPIAYGAGAAICNLVAMVSKMASTNRLRSITSWRSPA